MYLRELLLENFRNYNKEKIIFHPKFNIIWGDNCQGKTNLLEAIYLLSLTRSFREKTDLNLISFNYDYYNISGGIDYINNEKYDLSVAYTIKEGKSAFINAQKQDKFSKYIGIFSTILFCKEDLNIVKGGPDERRKFIDILISLFDKEYLKNLQIYRSILKRRNLILKTRDKRVFETIHAWDFQLSEAGVYIVKKRKEIIKKLEQLISGYLLQLEKYTNSVNFVYLTAFDSNAELTKENFHKMISSYIDKDTVKGYTTFGPHRDDINFLWNEKRLKEFGSDGVHKSFIIALKAAELDLIRDMKNEKAVLLMDDPFSDLDKNHKIALENIFPLADQCFISCLSHEKEFFTGRNSSFLEIRNGKVIEG